MNKSVNAAAITIVFLLFFAFPEVSKAAFSLAITSVNPVEISDKEQIVEVNLQIEDLPSGDSYFRAGWKSGTSYIGYIQNNAGNWIELRPLSGECFDYFKVNTATTSATLKIKIGEENDISNGVVPIKAHRLTSSCGSSYGSNEFNTTILLPTSAPSPTLAPTSAATSAATATPTAIPTITPTPKPSPTKTAVASPTPTVFPTEESKKTDGPIGFTTDTNLNLVKATPNSLVAGAKDFKEFPVLAFILIVTGVGFLGYVIYMIYNQNSGDRQKEI